MTPKTGTPASSRFEVTASQSTSKTVCKKLGGISLWSMSAESLDQAIKIISGSIERTAAAHLTITKAVLRKLVRDEHAASELEDRVFAAILGSVMRMGAIDSLVCASKNDRPFRVLVHHSQIPRLRQALDAATILLRRKRIVQVRDLERELFGSRRYNTWSSTSHVLGHLSFKGLASIGDEGEGVLVERLT